MVSFEFEISLLHTIFIYLKNIIIIVLNIEHTYLKKKKIYINWCSMCMQLILLNGYVFKLKHSNNKNKNKYLTIKSYET